MTKLMIYPASIQIVTIPQKQGSVNDLNEQLVIVPVFLYNKINVMTDQIEIL